MEAMEAAPPAERLLHATTSLCRTCKEAVPASVVALPGGEVWMQKSCDAHGAQEVRISTNAAWYERTRGEHQQFVPPRIFKKELEHGCPFDCGPCTSPHAEGAAAGRHDHERVQPRLPDLLRPQQERRRLPHAASRTSR